MIGILLLNAWLDQQKRGSSTKESTITAEGGEFNGSHPKHSHLDESNNFQREQNDKYAFGNEFYFSATAVADTDLLRCAATKASTRNLTVVNRSARSQKMRTSTDSVRSGSMSWWCNLLASLSALEDHKALFVLGSYRGRDDTVIQIYKVSMKHVDHVVCLHLTDDQNRDTKFQYPSLTRHPAALSRWLNDVGNRTLEVSALVPSSTTTPRILHLDSETEPERHARSEASQSIQRVLAAGPAAERKPRSEGQ